MTTKAKQRLKELRDDWRTGIGTQQSTVKVGRVLEFTEADRLEIHRHATLLLETVEQKRPGAAQIILSLFKVTQRAIARSHAT